MVEINPETPGVQYQGGRIGPPPVQSLSIMILNTARLAPSLPKPYLFMHPNATNAIISWIIS